MTHSPSSKIWLRSMSRAIKQTVCSHYRGVQVAGTPWSGDSSLQGTPLYRGLLSTGDTSTGDASTGDASLQGTPMIRGLLSTGDSSLQGTLLYRGHSDLGTPLYRGHLSTGDTSLQATPIYRDTSLQGTPLYMRHWSFHKSKALSYPILFISGCMCLKVVNIL